MADKTNFTLFTADDALHLSMELYDHMVSAEMSEVSLDSAVFIILVELADLYVRLFDPEDAYPIQDNVLFPGLIENLEDLRAGRMKA